MHAKDSSKLICHCGGKCKDARTDELTLGTFIKNRKDLLWWLSQHKPSSVAESRKNMWNGEKQTCSRITFL